MSEYKTKITLGGETYLAETWESIVQDWRNDTDKIRAVMDKYQLDKNVAGGSNIVDVVLSDYEKQRAQIALLQANLQAAGELLDAEKAKSERYAAAMDKTRGILARMPAVWGLIRDEAKSVWHGINEGYVILHQALSETTEEGETK